MKGEYGKDVTRGEQAGAATQVTVELAENDSLSGQLDKEG